MDTETKEFQAAKEHILKLVETTIEDAEQMRCLIYDRAGFDLAMGVLSKLTESCRTRRDSYLSDEGTDTLNKMLNAMSQLLGAVQMCSAFVMAKFRTK